MKKKTNIAIFASGSGTNAERIMRSFKKHPFIKIICLFSNNPAAYALERAKKFKLPACIFDKDTFYISDKIADKLKNYDVSLIVLAGFLWLIPGQLIKAYPNKIINIHPALLPRYGGKGMYGLRVHKAVIESGDKQSGITIHYVDSEYDKGKIIFQAKCPVKADDTPEVLAERVHQLEYKHYAEVIEGLAKKSFKIC
ncbi:MAG: phosphoribosylglycinamide formyltransferase [Bacteroidetes bacterium]|nr:phosphoribosylglycinamide formyltransferase [Bacteroidota bacterium]